MKEIKFYDVKGRKSFTTKKFIFKTERNPRTKKTTYFAVSDAPSEIKSWRIVSNDFYLGNK